MCVDGPFCASEYDGVIEESHCYMKWKKMHDDFADKVRHEAWLSNKRDCSFENFKIFIASARKDQLISHSLFTAIVYKSSFDGMNKRTAGDKKLKAEYNKARGILFRDWRNKPLSQIDCDNNPF